MPIAAITGLDVQKVITQCAQYIGILMTTALGIYALKRETVIKAKDPSQSNMFTDAGRQYLRSLIGLTVFTIAISIWGEIVDGKLNDRAKLEGDKRFQTELASANEGLIDSLTPKIQEQKNAIDKGITTLNKGIQDASTNLNTSLQSSSKQVEARLLETTDKVLTANDRLDFVRVRFGPEDLLKDDDRVSFVEDESKLGTRFHSVDVLTRSDECGGECRSGRILWHNYSGSRHLVRYIGRDDVSIDWKLRFRAFDVAVLLRHLTIGKPALYGGSLSFSQSDILDYVGVLGYIRNHSIPGVKDFRELDLYPLIPYDSAYSPFLSLEPFERSARVVRKDLEPMELRSETFFKKGAMGEKVKKRASHEPFRIEIDIKVENTRDEAHLVYEAMPILTRDVPFSDEVEELIVEYKLTLVKE